MKACGGVKYFRFDMGLKYFKYAVLTAGHKPRFNDASKMHLDNVAANCGGEWAEFPKVDFNYLKGQYPVTLKGINIFEMATKQLKIGDSVLLYDTEYEEWKLKDKKGAIYLVKAPSSESVKNWVWFL